MQRWTVGGDDQPARNLWEKGSEKQGNRAFFLFARWPVTGGHDLTVEVLRRLGDSAQGLVSKDSGAGGQRNGKERRKTGDVE